MKKSMSLSVFFRKFAYGLFYTLLYIAIKTNYFYMKHYYFLFLALLCALCIGAQTDDAAINVQLYTMTDGSVIAVDVTTTDSISFSADGANFQFHRGEKVTSLPVADVDVTYTTDMPDGLTVTYNGAKATVVNPYYTDGVTTAIDGAYVTINNTDTTVERTITLKGETEDGALTYNASYKTTFVLDGVNITSKKGAAIDIECGKRIALELKKGTVNSLTDYASGKQKAALYCKGHLEVDKAGTLNVTGNAKHAISAKEYVQFKKSTGTVNILGAKSDGIHCGQYFVSNGYTFNIDNVAGDGIQAEAETLKDGETWEEEYLNGSMLIQGGTYNINITADDCDALKADTTMNINCAKQATAMTLTTSGAADKGIKSKGSVNIDGATISITQTGNKIVEADDASYASGIKAALDVNITSGSVTINNTADGGKGISADGNVTISGDATVIDITADGKGGTYELTGESTETQTEQTVSYKMYFAKPQQTTQQMGMPGTSGAQAWGNNLYLYKGTTQGSGTLVATLTTTETLNGTTYYTYDLTADPSSTYYLQADDYTSRGRGTTTTYHIVSDTFTAANGGYYLTIGESYTEQSGYRIYSYSTSSTASAAETDAEESGETYSAICIKADNKLTINGGTLTLNNSGDMSKSLKADSIIVNGGNITSTVKGSLYVNGSNTSYCSNMKCDYYVGNGGTLTLTSSNGYASRAISADEDITINGGTYNISSSCNGYMTTFDHYTTKALKSDKSVNIIGGTVNIEATGTGGKGIKTGTTFVMGDKNTKTGPTLTIVTKGSALSSSSSGGMGGKTKTVGDPKGIKAIGAVDIYGGNLTITTATAGAEGLESKTGITIHGGNHYLKCYDDCINSSGIINFAGGNTVCYGFGNDAVDSNYGRTGAITISGGNVFAYTTNGSPEEGLDCDNNSYIVVTGGIAVSAGGSQGGGFGGSSGTQSIGSSSQGYYLGSSPSSYGSTYYYTLCNTSGTPICTYKFEANCSNTLSLLTAPALGTGSITVKQGTAKPTACDSSVSNENGTEVFFVNPTVTTTGTAATVTASK